MTGAMKGPIERNEAVVMERASLGDLPACALPEGFALRWYEPGDEQAWRHIQAAADQYNVITEALFLRTFGHDQAALRQRVCFLTTAEGAPVGTAAAWWGRDGARGRWGRVHWVALDINMGYTSG